MAWAAGAGGTSGVPPPGRRTRAWPSAGAGRAGPRAIRISWEVMCWSTRRGSCARTTSAPARQIGPPSSRCCALCGSEQADDPRRRGVLTAGHDHLQEAHMPLLTEPIGSIPRPPALIEGIEAFAAGRLSRGELDALYRTTVIDTIRLFEATGSPVITDGEQTKPSFATYPIHGLGSLAPDGVVITFADGHVRQLPRLTAGPFRYPTYADEYLEVARRHARVPVKQAVISASALSLLYPHDGIEGYSREAFIEDLLRENEADI